MPTVDLNRRRILVVEDEPLLAMDIIDLIEEGNGIVQSHETALERGMMALDRERPGACILNIYLGRTMVYDLADRLMNESIPFIFASSEPGSRIPDRFSGIPLHAKPIDMIVAAAGLMGTMR